MRIVVKFGGTSIKNVGRIKKAANFLKRTLDGGNEVIAVASAGGNSTNRLISMGCNFEKKESFSQEFLSLLSLGEKQSTILLSMALNSIGEKAKAITLSDEEWPLISEDMGEYAFLSKEKTNDIVDIKIDEEKTKKRFKTYIEPLLKNGIIPVISGFFIRDKNNAIVSLGRGGSDITAFLVGKYLNCDEVLIVTDVSGVYSADPKSVENPFLFDEISADDLTLLSMAGARVIHPNALRFKDKNLSSKIVNFKDLNKLYLEGTKIEGYAKTKLISNPLKLMMITFIGKNLSEKPGILSKMSTFFSSKGISIRSMSQSDSFINLYLEQQDGEKIYSEMYDAFIVKENLFLGVTNVKPIGEIILQNHLFIDSPGVISSISQILSRNKINIIEMITSHTDIIVYVKSDALKNAVDALKNKLKIKNA